LAPLRAERMASSTTTTQKIKEESEVIPPSEAPTFTMRHKVDLVKLLGDELVEHREEDGWKTVGTRAALQDRYVALYFSANWCPPCHAFTPKLVQAYVTLKFNLKKDFEVVFISLDKNAQEFKEYFNNMPWMAVPFSSRLKEICSEMAVFGIPTLMILDPQGYVITRNARSAVIEDPTCKLFPWEGIEDAGFSLKSVLKSPALYGIVVVMIYVLYKLFFTGDLAI
jgi:nucleoredoxin